MNDWTLVVLVLVGMLVILPASAYLVAKYVTYGILLASWNFHEYMARRLSQQERKDDGDEA